MPESPQCPCRHARGATMLALTGFLPRAGGNSRLHFDSDINSLIQQITLSTSPNYSFWQITRYVSYFYSTFAACREIAVDGQGKRNLPSCLQSFFEMQEQDVRVGRGSGTCENFSWTGCRFESKCRAWPMVFYTIGLFFIPDRPSLARLNRIQNGDTHSVSPRISLPYFAAFLATSSQWLKVFWCALIQPSV